VSGWVRDLSDTPSHDMPITSVWCRCDCLPGWFGLHCTQKTSICNTENSEALCGEHGVCVEKSGSSLGYTCICDQVRVALIFAQTLLRPSQLSSWYSKRVHVNWHGKRWFSHVSSSGMGERRREPGLHQGRGRMCRGPSALFCKSAGAVPQHTWLVHLRCLSPWLQRQRLLLHRHWRVSDQQRRLQHFALRAVHKHGGKHKHGDRERERERERTLRGTSRMSTRKRRLKETHSHAISCDSSTTL